MRSAERVRGTTRRVREGIHGRVPSWAERPGERIVQRGLERIGFVPVEEERSVAMTARLDTQKALWALKGLDHMLRRDPSAGEATDHNPRIIDLIGSATGEKTEENPRLDALMRRLQGVPQRKRLLEATIDAALSGDPEKSPEARRRLGLVMDIVDDKLAKPNPDGHKAVILAQTAYVIGSKEKYKADANLSYKLGNVKQFGVDLASGSMPYLGAAVLYSELMATGRFSDIEIIDFRDKKAIDEMIARGDREYALISGATTYDRHITDALNEKLSNAGLAVVNGGVAAGIDEDPKRVIDKGGSLFVGDFEGAADLLVDQLEASTEPRVFLRGRSLAKRRWLERDGVPVTELDDLPLRAVLHEAYSKERELDGDRLANRLLALESMRPFIEFGDKTYESSPFFRFHEMSASYGCPEACSFCATVPLQGREMRARSIGSIQQEMAAIETRNIAIVDQNFLANGRDYVTDVLRTTQGFGKKVAFEGELLFFLTAPSGQEANQNYFFNGTQDDAERERLLQRTVIGIESGLEQPVKVRGTIEGGKDPSQFAVAQKRLNKLGVRTFGTVVVGIPPELWPKTAGEKDLSIVPVEGMDDKAWKRMVDTWVKWLEEIGVTGPVIFPYGATPGTPDYRNLRDNDKLIFDDVSGLPIGVKGMDTQRAVNDIKAKVYSQRSIKRRLGQANFNLRSNLLMYFFNIVADRAFRNAME